MRIPSEPPKEQDREIRDLTREIRINHLQGRISPRPAGLLFHHQTTIKIFFSYIYIYIFFLLLDLSFLFLFFYKIMDGKEGPGFKIDRRRIFMKTMVDEKDRMKRDTGRVALIPLEEP